MAALFLSLSAQNGAAWLKEAKWGVMLHYTATILASENHLDPDSISLDNWNDLINNFASLAAALRAGNPNSSVAFNPGVFPRIVSITPYEDYSAGEINDPDACNHVL